MTNNYISKLLERKMREHLPEPGDPRFIGLLQNLARDTHKYLGISQDTAQRFIQSTYHGRLLPSQNSQKRIRERLRRLSLLLEKFDVPTEDPLIEDIRDKISPTGLEFEYPPREEKGVRTPKLEEKLRALAPEHKAYVTRIIDLFYENDREKK
jgi:hypothetical protein